MVFSPSAPIDENDLFAGRQNQISKLIEAVLQRGQHAIIYGERGVGKTSLARTFSNRLSKPTQSISSLFVNCTPNDDFGSLWQKVYTDLSDGQNSLRAKRPEDITPDDVRRTLADFDLTTTPIIILDEFDKLKNHTVRELMANTIKALSDYSVHATLVLVGVADSVSELIAEHESIERSLVQIPMPRMNEKELEEILTKRLTRLGMTMTKDARAQIIVLSRGLPHYTHMLGQCAVRVAIAEKILAVTEAHVDTAQEAVLERVDQSIRRQYHLATHSPRSGNIFQEVLLASALVAPDEMGYFQPVSIEVPLSAIMGAPYKVPKFGQHLKKLCDANRGSILEVMGTNRRFRYRFAEPLMQPYVILKGLASGLISKQTVRKMMPNPLQPRLSSEF